MFIVKEVADDFEFRFIAPDIGLHPDFLLFEQIKFFEQSLIIAAHGQTLCSIGKDLDYNSFSRFVPLFSFCTVIECGGSSGNHSPAEYRHLTGESRGIFKCESSEYSGAHIAVSDIFIRTCGVGIYLFWHICSGFRPVTGSLRQLRLNRNILIPE